MAQMQALLEVMRMCTWPTSRLLRSVRRAACGVRLACRCRVLSLIRFSLSLSLSLSLSSLERGPVLPLIHHLPACLVCDCLPPSGPVGPAAHPDQVLRPVHHPAPRVARRQQQGGSGSGGPAVRCAVAGIRTTNSTTAPSLLAYLYAIPIQTTPAFFLNPTACPPPCPVSPSPEMPRELHRPVHRGFQPHRADHVRPPILLLLLLLLLLLPLLLLLSSPRGRSPAQTLIRRCHRGSAVAPWFFVVMSSGTWRPPGRMSAPA